MIEIFFAPASFCSAARTLRDRAARLRADVFAFAGPPTDATAARTALSESPPRAISSGFDVDFDPVAFNGDEVRPE